MLRQAFIVSAVLVPMCHAAPSFAGMRQDLASCTAAKGRSSAAACTRVMNSGRLPRSQSYIGHFNRGSSYRRAGDFRKALADFQKVVALKPRFARGYHARGLAYEDLGKRDKALADLQRAIKLNKKDWSAYYSRASLRRAEGSYDAALRDLKTAANLKPSKTHIGLLRALVLADKGAISVARAEINKIIANGNGNASSYYARAEVAFVEERLDASEDDLDRVLKLKPDYGPAHLLMGRILAARGDTAGARRAIGVRAPRPYRSWKAGLSLVRRKPVSTSWTVRPMAARGRKTSPSRLPASLAPSPTTPRRRWRIRRRWARANAAFICPRRG